MRSPIACDAGRQSGALKGFEMSYSVFVGRDIRGAVFAESNVEFGAGRLLRVSTRKTSRGLVCSATAGQPTAGNGFMWAPFSDYSKTISHDRAARCTEKTVRAMHAAGLAHLPELIRAAEAHYSPAQQSATV